MVTTKTLSELLREVEERFYANKPAEANPTYLFSLSKLPGGWIFRVVDNWNLWMAAGLQYEFGRFATSEEAVEAFLDYVRKNGINVAGLQK